MSHTDNEKREPACGPQMGGPKLVQFTDSLASLGLLSTSSSRYAREFPPRYIGAVYCRGHLCGIAAGTLAIAIFLPRLETDLYARISFDWKLDGSYRAILLFVKLSNVSIDISNIVRYLYFHKRCIVLGDKR